VSLSAPKLAFNVPHAACSIQVQSEWVTMLSLRLTAAWVSFCSVTSLIASVEFGGEGTTGSSFYSNS